MGHTTTLFLLSWENGPEGRVKIELDGQEVQKIKVEKSGSAEAQNCAGAVSFSTTMSSESLFLIDLAPSRFLLFLPK